MSRETYEDLNTYFLIGNCKSRPRAWHDDAGLRQRLGLEDNHYQDPIPYAEVVRRLFNWKPLSVPTANLIPCEKADANFFMEDGTPVRIVVVDDAQGIVRSDNHKELGHHGAGYQIHDYEDWLLKLQSNVIGDSLTILGAGLPRGGAQAYVQVALPDTAHDDKTGVDFIPYIMASTSLDGSLPTTFGAQSILVVCDNTRNMALRQSQNSGRIFKAKHTSKSLDTNRIKDVRESLRIIHQTADAMIAEFHELAAIPVSRKEWQKVMDVLIPIPLESDGASKRSISIATNKQDVLNHTYWRDPMMANQQGTALGVVQAVNTWETHYRTVQGNRFERNMDKAIRGEFGKVDGDTIKALSLVLDKPELVSTN
jgi:phage/plasmid-like protein (TIGR03299 family)